MRAFIKHCLLLLASLATWPLGALTGFGRAEEMFAFCAQCLSLVPGLPGDYLRGAFYGWTLDRWGSDSRIRFGSIFTHPRVRIGDKVSIGMHCKFGYIELGDHVRVAAGVQVLSGRGHHRRDRDGRLQNALEHDFKTVRIGANCWIGAGAIVMADVGEGTTVGAGSVVVKPLPSGCTAVGSPARVVMRADAEC